MIKKIAKKSIKKHKRIKKEENSQAFSLYKQIKSSHKQDPKYQELQLELKKLKSQIQNHQLEIDKLEYEFHEIHSKDLPDNVVERMPIEDLHELSGKKNNKASLNDAIRLGRIQKEIEGLLEDYDILHSKKKLLEVEMLQVKINNLINYGKNE